MGGRTRWDSALQSGSSNYEVKIVGAFVGKPSKGREPLQTSMNKKGEEGNEILGEPFIRRKITDERTIRFSLVLCFFISMIFRFYYPQQIIQYV